mmetsp:Transcript_31721/g.36062  ORF Transcript_31721/g.36062 Transcript_31721/m.36062 type:complete len:830 (-) Transcript_31721:593-3082(-)
MGVKSVMREDDNLTVESSSSIPIPRRNLAEAFDDLYVDTTTPATKDSIIVDGKSPVGVCDLGVTESRGETCAKDIVKMKSKNEYLIPNFQLHQELERDLSQELVNRVSFYTVIHDINKEATTMASNDFATFTRTKSTDEGDESHSPIVMSVKGQPIIPRQPLSMARVALIDEERWLLMAIDARGDIRSSGASCPPTFLQAMGERDYENPLSSLEFSRTQLWKPSRSWWEAKSGKNPWIEPKSHNKRWRYLWPLIHYHKFLAKCIKKLKRNGVDVKVSISPVAVFLREEVCAISDHLAAVSLFQSEQWMNCLEHFDGWTDTSPEAEARMRRLIEKLKLRPLDEPGDVDSPLLRNQIDEQFLRAMVAAREGMAGVTQHTKKSCLQKPAMLLQSVKNEDSTKNSNLERPGLPLHPRSRTGNLHGTSQPSNIPTKPRSNVSVQSSHLNQASNGDGSGDSRPSFIYHSGQWWSNGWAPQYAFCDETTSVHSALSGDSYPFGHPGHYDPNFHGMYRPMHPYYAHQPSTPEESVTTETTGYLQNVNMPFYPNYESFSAEQSLIANPGWYGQMPNPNMMFTGPPTPTHANVKSNGIPENEGSETSQDATIQTGQSPYGGTIEHTPHKDYTHTPMPLSPFWGHLDYQMHTTLAMAGAITPHKSLMRSPPRQAEKKEISEHNKNSEEEKKDCGDTRKKEEIEAKPLLINHPSQYFSYGPSYGNRDGLVPPSPATQFMMSPQATSQAAAYYAYNYGASAYYHSPYRSGSRKRIPRVPCAQDDIVKNEEVVRDANKMTPPPMIRKKPVKSSDSIPTNAAAADMSDSDLTSTSGSENKFHEN